MQRQMFSYPFPGNKSERFMSAWREDDFPTAKHPVVEQLAPGYTWRGSFLFQTGFGDYEAPSKFCDMTVGDMKRTHKFLNSGSRLS